jgi:hypothetical protein
VALPNEEFAVLSDLFGASTGVGGSAVVGTGATVVGGETVGEASVGASSVSGALGSFAVTTIVGASTAISLGLGVGADTMVGSMVSIEALAGTSSFSEYASWACAVILDKHNHTTKPNSLFICETRKRDDA